MDLMIDAKGVAQLIAAQFPSLAHLPLSHVESGGTDNHIFRLGKDLGVRLPRFKHVAEQIEKEYKWLPIFTHIPHLAIPTPLKKGLPFAEYPWSWSIFIWIHGDNALNAPIADLKKAAHDLGQFIAALQRIDPTHGPLCSRGVPLIQRDSSTRKAIEELKDIYSIPTLMALWEKALKAPEYQGSPVWLHGDLHGGNLLVNHGRLCAVIDFGMMGIGDPACDIMVAWTLLSNEARKVFRKNLTVDDAIWERGWGWALSFGVVALAYYRDKNPILSSIARYTINEVLSDII
ncbi:MAG: aminoglycoside phosphotransferase family protein [Alphaproteobacteria bacterium]|nr:aminoglycoside phosphotransferase family protein [Alphaproteobacteria bacterium]